MLMMNLMMIGLSFDFDYNYAHDYAQFISMVLMEKE
jgi:hypothetical protein